MSRISAVILALLVPASAIPSRYRDTIKGNSYELNIQSKYYEQSFTDAKRFQTIKQVVDHFDSSNTATFSQRYFVNMTQWDGNGPIFLCVGGEGPPLSVDVLVDSDHCSDMVALSGQLHALTFALEHRYYGPSVPGGFGNYSTENLQWLTTEQAAKDIQAFIILMNKHYNIPSTSRWVTWGGSYPGMLASIARLDFPELVYAAVGSSAPLQAAVEMPGYNEVIGADLANEGVGGSTQCQDIVTSGHATVKSLLSTSEGRRSLESTFNVCLAETHPLDDPLNQAEFAGSGVVYIPGQSNDPACTTDLCNIEKVCSFLLASPATSPIDKLASLSKQQQGGACVPVNFDVVVKALTSPDSTARIWQYQTCSEWGFYMTCEESGGCPFVSGLPLLDASLEICETAFGITPDQVSANIDAAVARYGGAQSFNATRVLFVNGQVDPWNANSWTETPPGSDPALVPAFWVPYTAHHFWTHGILPTDTAYVQTAREQIYKQVTEWLAQ